MSEIHRIDVSSGRMIEAPAIYLPQLRVVNPQQAHRVLLTEGFATSGYQEPNFTVTLLVDMVPIELFRATAEQIMEAYERAHHLVHGSDVRGLDPREGPTRLTSGFERNFYGPRR